MNWFGWRLLNGFILAACIVIAQKIGHVTDEQFGVFWIGIIAAWAGQLVVTVTHQLEDSWECKR